MPAKLRLKLQLLLLIAVFSFTMSFSCCNARRSQNNDTTISYNYHWGSWQSVEISSSIKIIFTPDTLKYNITLNGEDYTVINGEYTCLANDDTLFIQTIEEKPFRLRMIRTGQNNAVLAIYKGTKGTEDHIAFAFLIEKVSVEIHKKEEAAVSEMYQEKAGQYDTYILPFGFTGVMAIAYDQTDGMLPAYDNLGGKIYSLVDNDDFFAKVRSGPDVIGYAMNKMKFYYLGSDSVVPLRSYYIFDTIPQQYAPTENHVFLVGYNRIGRRGFNKIANDTIEGNILFLKVGMDAFYSENTFGADSVQLGGKYYRLRDY